MVYYRVVIAADDAGEEASPVAGHPFRAVLTPKHGLVAFLQSGQDLDVLAPGFVVPVAGPLGGGGIGQVDYTFVFGTSFASPHVAACGRRQSSVPIVSVVATKKRSLPTTVMAWGVDDPGPMTMSAT